MMHVATSAALLFGYAFLSNVALAFLPHEPVVIWYGARLGVWPTSLVASAGTVLAAVVDHRVFVPLIERIAARRARVRGATWPERVFARFPFAILALSGLTPLAWLFAALFALLLIPSLRMLWPPPPPPTPAAS